MIGYTVGLGDRHLENILIETTTGSLMHVDFACLFDHGLNLETPERVPFRLTQNLHSSSLVTWWVLSSHRYTRLSSTRCFPLAK